jgi:hypothetical protein
MTQQAQIVSFPAFHERELMGFPGMRRDVRVRLTQEHRQDILTALRAGKSHAQIARERIAYSERLIGSVDGNRPRAMDANTIY